MNMKTIVKFFIFPLLILVSADTSNIGLAQNKGIVEATFKYVMGDNDSKNDARKIAFIEAKRLCVEKAGTYLESNTEIMNFRLSKDEIKVYSGGILKVEIVSEEFRVVGENTTLLMTVRAEIDIGEIKERIRQIRADRELEGKIKEQEKQLQILEKRIREIQKQLEETDFEKTAQARLERKEIFDKLAEFERIKNEIKFKTKLAAENIEIAMTEKEVVKLIGEPRSKTICTNIKAFNYGMVWIIFEHEIVKCIVKEDAFSKCASCGYYKTFRKKQMVKY